MAQKHKEQIIEILKLSGPLPYSVLKERILSALQIEEDGYPKSTMQRHLEQLADESKIDFRMIDGKRHYFIHKHDHQVPGGLLLENLGGKITVSPGLLPFGLKVDKAQKDLRNSEHLNVFIEFNSTNISLSIHKEAFPLSIHISRKVEGGTFNELHKIFGGRLISLELPVSTISSYKSEQKTGHVIFKFSENKKVLVCELGATNPLEHVDVSGLSLETFTNELSIISPKTVRNEVNERSLKIKGKMPIESRSEKSFLLPAIFQLSIDSSIAIF